MKGLMKKGSVAKIFATAFSKMASDYFIKPFWTYGIGESFLAERK
jgi:hypothetical protein